MPRPSKPSPLLSPQTIGTKRKRWLMKKAKREKLTIQDLINNLIDEEMLREKY